MAFKWTVFIRINVMHKTTKITQNAKMIYNYEYLSHL